MSLFPWKRFLYLHSFLFSSSFSSRFLVSRVRELRLIFSCFHVKIQNQPLSHFSNKAVNLEQLKIFPVDLGCPFQEKLQRKGEKLSPSLYIFFFWKQVVLSNLIYLPQSMYATYNSCGWRVSFYPGWAAARDHWNFLLPKAQDWLILFLLLH